MTKKEIAKVGAIDYLLAKGEYDNARKIVDDLLREPLAKMDYSAFCDIRSMADEVCKSIS